MLSNPFSKCFEHINTYFTSYHDNMSLKARQKVKEDFDKGIYNYLFATNLAARGIDFQEVTCVINCDIPLDIRQRKINDESSIKPN